MPGINTNGLPAVPAGYTFTGNELVPVDTGLGQGINPATFAMALSLLGFAAIAQSTPLTGFSITVPPGTNAVNLTPAGTLAAGTIVFPSNATNGQQLKIFSSQTVTALTLTPGTNLVGGVATNQNIVGAVTTIAANTSVQYVYQGSNNTWYRNG